MTNSVMLELTHITQKAALAETPKAQVQTIVDAISSVISVDVCSLYLQNNEKEMMLIASHGLAMNHPVVIPAGKGLVGRVVEYCHTINIKDPEHHPDYYYLPQSREEQFHSFCGVPLVRSGQVIGVLVVQSRRAETLAVEQEAFITTLASHLALMVSDLPVQNSLVPSGNQRYQGISGATGVAIGVVKLSKPTRLMAVADGQTENTADVLAQWRLLRTSVITELKKERDIVEQALGDSLAAVLDAYRMLLEDPDFIVRVEDEIYAKKTLPTALKHTVQYLSEQFLSMDDPYLRARHEDIQQLGDKLYGAWVESDAAQQKVELTSPIVLMGNQIAVSEIVSLPVDKLAAIVCYSGAALSHIAIFANALGIPAVMGVGELQHVTDGDQIIVDGNTGQLIHNPSETLIKEYESLISHREDFNQQLQSIIALSPETSDGTRMELLVNSGLQADIMPGIRNGAEGIGLYRTEIPFMLRNNLPSEEEQQAVYQRVFRAYAKKPVFVRTLDIGSDKPLPYLPVIEEENPALGWRGIRFTLDNRQLLITQLRAILKAAEGKKTISIMLPMISTTSELDQCIRLLDETYKQLKDEGEHVVRPQLGVMIEVPGTVSLLPFWQDKLDFISIGSNDLCQYLLAIDRNSTLVGKLYDPLHPSVVDELQRIVSIARQYQLPVSLCGEMASDPVSVMLLMGLGIRRISTSASKLPLIKWIVRSLSIRDAEQFFHQARTLDNGDSIRKLGLQTLKNVGIDLGHS